MNHPALSLQDVSVAYDGVAALRHVTFTLPEKASLAIVGPNGGGKTTLLKTILGLLQPSAGRVVVLGMQPARARRLVGYVPQISLFDPDFPLTVWDCVLLGRLPKKKAFSWFDHEDREMARRTLDDVGMYGLRSRLIGRLSGGQRQRVFIARALVSEPRMLLLDEPLANIDPTMRISLEDLLQRLRNAITLVMVTHEIAQLAGAIDTLACLDGEMFFHGTKDEIEKHAGQGYKCPVELLSQLQAPAHKARADG